MARLHLPTLAGIALCIVSFCQVSAGAADCNAEQEKVCIAPDTCRQRECHIAADGSVGCGGTIKARLSLPATCQAPGIPRGQCENGVCVERTCTDEEALQCIAPDTCRQRECHIAADGSVGCGGAITARTSPPDPCQAHGIPHGQCDDNGVCVPSSCTEEEAATCSHLPAPDDTCMTTCHIAADGSVGCGIAAPKSSPPAMCTSRNQPDGGVCAEGVCEPDPCTSSNLKNGDACDNEAFASQGVCDTGICTLLEPGECTDDNLANCEDSLGACSGQAKSCSFDSGQVVGTCGFVSGATCDDDDENTIQDMCQADGKCAGTHLLPGQCTDTVLDKCGDPSCIMSATCSVATGEVVGTCEYASGTTCDDNDANTFDDMCQAGKCAGTPCGRGNADNLYYLPSGGCDHKRLPDASIEDCETACLAEGRSGCYYRYYSYGNGVCISIDYDVCIHTGSQDWYYSDKRTRWRLCDQ